MDVEQTNFVTHLIITVQLYYIDNVEIRQISFKW